MPSMHFQPYCASDAVPVVALETAGSNCFYQSLALNPGVFSVVSEAADGVRAERCADFDVTVAHLPKLTSRATSLGASSPAAGAIRMALDRKGGIKSVCVDDEFAMKAALLFAGGFSLESTPFSAIDR